MKMFELLGLEHQLNRNLFEPDQGVGEARTCLRNFP
jgi:hypothetical protein